MKALEGLDEPWLLVLDNVTDPDELAGLVPQTGTGEVLVSSRHRFWTQTTFSTVEVDVLADDDAVELLLTMSGSSDREGAVRLARRLDGLALACEQAGATIGQRGWSFDQYEALLAQRPAEMLDLPVDGLDRTVWVALSSAIEQAEQDSPLVKAVLGIAAYCHADGIPRWLFEGDHPEGVQLIASGDPIAVGGAISTLAQYHIVRANPTSVSVHRVIQELVRLSHHVADNEYQNAALHLLDKAQPRVENDPASFPISKLLAPHIEALADASPPSDTLGFLLIWSGSMLRYAGDYPQARRALEAAYELRKEMLGERHPNTLASLNSLAGIRQAQGELEAARLLLQKAYDARVEVLGEHHPETVVSLNNLAFIMQSQGELDAARPLLQKAYDTSVEVVGEHHPDTLISLSNLASIMQDKNSTPPAPSSRRSTTPPLRFSENATPSPSPRSTTSPPSCKTRGNSTAPAPSSRRSTTPPLRFSENRSTSTRWT